MKSNASFPYQKYNLTGIYSPFKVSVADECVTACRQKAEVAPIFKSSKSLF